MSRSTPKLADCPIGVVPIVWNNVDLPGLTDTYGADLVLDEIARLGFAGCQHGVDFPERAELVEALRRRNLKMAEVYASIPCDEDGPSADAYERVMARFELLDSGEGEMLVVALDTHEARSEFAARTSDPRCPTLSKAAWERLGILLEEIAAHVANTPRKFSFHPHVGTFIENTAETDRLMDSIRPDGMGLCLDVGHYLLGGGDPIEAITSYAELITHVHLKDVTPAVMADLTKGHVDGFEAALRQRVFCELGSGALDITAVLRALEEIKYQGWLMIEQDTTWLAPSEASAIGLHITEFAINHLLSQSNTSL